jgi:hypothetical protein
MMFAAVRTASFRSIVPDPMTYEATPVRMHISHSAPAALATRRGMACSIDSISFLIVMP